MFAGSFVVRKTGKSCRCSGQQRSRCRRLVTTALFTRRKTENFGVSPKGDQHHALETNNPFDSVSEWMLNRSSVRRYYSFQGMETSAGRADRRARSGVWKLAIAVAAVLLISVVVVMDAAAASCSSREHEPPWWSSWTLLPRHAQRREATHQSPGGLGTTEIGSSQYRYPNPVQAGLRAGGGGGGGRDLPTTRGVLEADMTEGGQKCTRNRITRRRVDPTNYEYGCSAIEVNQHDRSIHTASGP